MERTPIDAYMGIAYEALRMIQMPQANSWTTQGIVVGEIEEAD